MGKSLDDFSISDLFFKIENSSDAKAINDDIAIIDVSDVYDRGEIADIIEKVTLTSPKALGLDIIFEGVKDDSIGNAKLHSVLQSNKSLVIANKLTEYNDQAEVFFSRVRNFFESDSSHYNIGYTNLPIDNANQTVRDFSYSRILNDSPLPSFPNEVFRVAYDKDFEIRDDSFINYESTEFLTINAYEIEDFLELFEGKIILIGATQEESDKYFTPIGRMPGVIIHAHAISSIIKASKRKEVPEWLNYLIALILIYVTLLSTNRIDNWCDSHRILQYWDGPIRFFFVTFFLLLLLFSDYLLYIYLQIYVELSTALLGIAAVDSLREVYSSLLNSLATIKPKCGKIIDRYSQYKNIK